MKTKKNDIKALIQALIKLDFERNHPVIERLKLKYAV